MLATTRILLIAALLGVTSSAAVAQKAQVTRFWNLTGTTITAFELAPVGTTAFGPNQCKNDKDGAVDHDERLKITDVAAGVYDARIAFKGGRVCVAKALKLETGKIFSVEAQGLSDCKPK